jgi:hypothetical protein
MLGDNYIKFYLIYEEIEVHIAQFWRYLFAANTGLFGVRFLVQEEEYS